LRWRSMKGLDQLRGILGQRTAFCSAAVLTAFMAREAAATAPAAALASLTASVSAGVSEGGRAALIAKKALDGLFWARVKVCSLRAAAAVTVAGAVVPFVLPPSQPVPTAAAVNPVQLGVNASLGGRRPFPDDNPWNQDISAAPVDPNSDRLI